MFVDVDTNTIMPPFFQQTTQLAVINCVRLNGTKCILLHEIRLRYLDRLNCDAPLNMVDINSYATDEINHIRTNYLESR